MNDVAAESLHSLYHKVLPIIGYMTGVVVLEDEEKDLLRIFVATKTAKRDLEMLISEELMNRISIEIAEEIYSSKNNISKRV